MQCLLQLLRAIYVELCWASVSFLFSQFFIINKYNNNNNNKNNYNKLQYVRNATFCWIKAGYTCKTIFLSLTLLCIQSCQRLSSNIEYYVIHATKCMWCLMSTGLVCELRCSETAKDLMSLLAPIQIHLSLLTAASIVLKLLSSTLTIIFVGLPMKIAALVSFQNRTRCFVESLPDDRCVFKLVFSNAFNSQHHDVTLEAVFEVVPGM